MNDQRRQQEDHARNLRNFAAAFGRGQAKAMDRFGNEMREGDKMMIRFAIDPVVDVVSVNPVLDPKAPAGLIDVVCTVTFPLRVPAGQPYQGCNIIARRQETAVPAGSDNGKGPTLALVETSAPEGTVDPVPTSDDDNPVPD